MIDRDESLHTFRFSDSVPRRKDVNFYDRQLRARRSPVERAVDCSMDRDLRSDPGENVFSEASRAVLVHRHESHSSLTPEVSRRARSGIRKSIGVKMQKKSSARNKDFQVPSSRLYDERKTRQ